jgi:hypothetical protein
MKLLVFPEARRDQVEVVIREALGHLGGTEELTLTVVRMSAPPDWTVHARASVTRCWRSAAAT